MGLTEDLQAVAANLDPSLQPSSNQVAPLLGALIAYTEHGDKVVKAAEQGGTAGVSELLAGGGDTGSSKDAGSSKDTSTSSSSGKADK